VGQAVVKGEALLDNRDAIAQNMLQAFRQSSHQVSSLAGQTTLVTRASIFSRIQSKGYLPVTLDIKAKWLAVEYPADGALEGVKGCCPEQSDIFSCVPLQGCGNLTLSALDTGVPRAAWRSTCVTRHNFRAWHVQAHWHTIQNQA
jgi:hypothetical protein